MDTKPENGGSGGGGMENENNFQKDDPMGELPGSCYW